MHVKTVGWFRYKQSAYPSRCALPASMVHLATLCRNSCFSRRCELRTGVGVRGELSTCPDPIERWDDRLGLVGFPPSDVVLFVIGNCCACLLHGKTSTATVVVSYKRYAHLCAVPPPSGLFGIMPAASCKSPFGKHAKRSSEARKLFQLLPLSYSSYQCQWPSRTDDNGAPAYTSTCSYR